MTSSQVNTGDADRAHRAADPILTAVSWCGDELDEEK